MEELIWFSIPGAFAVLAVILGFPTLSLNQQKAAVLCAPVLGFIIHQFMRCLFEVEGGFHSSHRTVIREIQKAYGLPHTRQGRRDAFLIWETTFYSNAIPEPFRAHDRGAWHYILSFWSVALAAVLAAALLLVLVRIGTAIPHLFHWLILLGLAAALFTIKGIQTFCSLRAQEVAVFNAHRKSFNNTRKQIAEQSPASDAGKAAEDDGLTGAPEG